MGLRPRFVGHLGVADAATVGNAVVGFLAVAVAATDPSLAARLVLLAAVLDGLDGVLARSFGSSRVGATLDSLSDVASFGVAPAVIVASVTGVTRGAPPALPLVDQADATAIALVVPAAFVASAVVRLGLYTVRDAPGRTTLGVPTTLAATVLASGLLAGPVPSALVLAATAVFAYLMVTSVPYPDLRVRHALGMGLVQVGAVAVPGAWGHAFSRVLLVAAVAYLVLAPVAYPQDGDAAGDEQVDAGGTDDPAVARDGKSASRSSASRADD